MFPREKGKVRTKPKIRSFQIKTNKIPEITGKGLVTQREGVSTQSVLGTPREPFLYAYVLGTKMMFTNK